MVGWMAIRRIDNHQSSVLATSNFLNTVVQCWRHIISNKAFVRNNFDSLSSRNFMQNTRNYFSRINSRFYLAFTIEKKTINKRTGTDWNYEINIESKRNFIIQIWIEKSSTNHVASPLRVGRNAHQAFPHEKDLLQFCQTLFKHANEYVLVMVTRSWKCAWGRLVNWSECVFIWIWAILAKMGAYFSFLRKSRGRRKSGCIQRTNWRANQIFMRAQKPENIKMAKTLT